MKIIHVAGRSNTGKTTLIKQLIPALAEKGSVGVIKHLGDHRYELAQGKDTTEFFSAGATIAVGIDAEKSVAAIRTTNLDDSLSFLHSEGMDFAVIEGFKARSFPKIILGDLAAENCVLRNPSVMDVIANLDRFSDYTPSATNRRTH
jgi:molybdopterin-guanine dinucleotide biosynthesis protein MobB